MKATVSNIINLWFGADTPIRQYKIKLNPKLWVACSQVSKNFSPPSGIDQVENYRKSDKVAFAEAVLEKLGHTVDQEQAVQV
jgi:hypothetical protein